MKKSELIESNINDTECFMGRSCLKIYELVLAHDDNNNRNNKNSIHQWQRFLERLVHFR